MKQLNWYQIFGKSNIPDGRTVLPTDDIQIWLHCANIWNKSYTTLAEVLADTDTLLALINSNNAVDYMVRSTTWASGLTANSTAMTDIGLNNYCANTLLSDTTWREAILLSEYRESVCNIKAPIMTSDTTPSGVCSASSVYSTGFEPFRAFDGDDSTRAAFGRDDTTRYIQYDFGSARTIYGVALKPLLISAGITVKTFKVSYSTDNVTFTDVDTYIHGNNDNLEVFALPNKVTGRCLRVRVIDGYAVTSFNNICTLQFYGREDV